MNKKAILSGIFSALFVVLAVFLGAYYWYESYEEPEETQKVVNSPVEVKEDIIVTEKIDVEYEPQEKEEEVASTKRFIEPLEDGKVVRKFFDLENSEEDKLNSIVEYNGVYRPSMAVSYSKNGEATNVLAVADGTIKSISTDSLLGNRVTMQCGTYTIIYYSIDNINVVEGQQMKQGNTIGKCSTNVYDSDLERHVSISVMCNGEYVDFENMLEL